MDSLEDRFWANVAREDADECWLWLGYVAPTGYGRMRFDGQMLHAHRVSHELFVGPIPKGWTVDHLCHGWDASCMKNASCQHRRCVNPAHLEAVTYQLNRIRGRATEAKRLAMLAKTHCPNGHALTPDNTFGVSRCRECRSVQASLARQARRGPVTEVCGYLSPKGNVCQRQTGHEGRHHGEKPRHKVSLLPSAS